MVFAGNYPAVIGFIVSYLNADSLVISSLSKAGALPGEVGHSRSGPSRLPHIVSRVDSLVLQGYINGTKMGTEQLGTIS